MSASELLTTHLTSTSLSSEERLEDSFRNGRRIKSLSSEEGEELTTFFKEALGSIASSSVHHGDNSSVFLVSASSDSSITPLNLSPVTNLASSKQNLQQISTRYSQNFLISSSDSEERPISISNSDEIENSSVETQSGEILEEKMNFYTLIKQLLKLVWFPFKLLLKLMWFVLDLEDNLKKMVQPIIDLSHVMGETKVLLEKFNRSRVLQEFESSLKSIALILKGLQNEGFDKESMQLLRQVVKILKISIPSFNIPILGEHIQEILASINKLLSLMAGNDKKSGAIDAEFVHSCKMIGRNLDILIEDMVLLGPYKGIKGAWEEYRRKRLESYEKLHSKEDFLAAAKKEFNDLHVVMHRYRRLLQKAEKKAHHTVLLEELTLFLHSLQSDVSRLKESS